MTIIAMQFPTLSVIVFVYPLATCSSYLLPKANLPQGGWVFSTFKYLQEPKLFAFLGFQTT